MEALFHLLFELIKISILASIYATLTLLAFKIIGHFKPHSWFHRASKKELRFWFLSGLFISAGLLFYLFSYFGNHGLGDSARVPVGHFRVVRQINGNDAYLQNSKGDQLGINNFVFDKDYLFAETQKEYNSAEGNYVIWDLKTDDWTFYSTKEDYIKIANQHNYPLPDQFEDFWTFYRRHWSGWRFWVLP